MKKKRIYIGILASLVFLVNASVWEGAAAVASGAELPDSGLYIATNSYPANTLVELTNLENGRTVKVISSTGLETPGLLALLSREAANAIGLPARSIGRIRMSQTEDPLAFSRFNDELSSSGDPDYDPSVFVSMNSYEELIEDEVNPGNGRIDGGELIVDLPDTEEESFEEYIAPEYLVPALALEETLEESDITEEPVIAGEPEIIEEPLIAEEPEIIEEPVIAEEPEITEETLIAEEPVEADYDLALVPAESRPPEDFTEIDPELIIAPIEEAPATEPLITEALPQTVPFEIAPVEEIPEIVIAAEPEIYIPPSDDVFSAPLINSLEKGKYYLQIAAYSKTETVESELAKIDPRLPRAIMKIGSDDKPVYRILIGPVNLGESGALLQRFKLDFKDAFVRQGT